MTNVFFSILIRKESQKLQFTWTDNSVHPPSCRLGAVLIPLPSVIVLPEEPSTNVLQIITLFHYIDDVLLTSDSFACIKQLTVKAVSHDVHCTVKAMYYDIDSEL